MQLHSLEPLVEQIGAQRSLEEWWALRQSIVVDYLKGLVC